MIRRRGGTDCARPCVPSLSLKGPRRSKCELCVEDAQNCRKPLVSQANASVMRNQNVVDVRSCVDVVQYM